MEIENENEKKRIGKLILIVVIVILVLAGSYFFIELNTLKTENDIDTKETEIKDKKDENDEKDDKEKETNHDSKTSEPSFDFKKVSNIIFQYKNDHLSVNDYDKEDFVMDVVALSGKNIDEVTGTELKTLARKYFDSDLEFVDLTCPWKDSNHNSVMYIFNSSIDKYEYNVNHPGHGGGSDGISVYLADGEVSTDGEHYVYSEKIFYYYHGCVWDTCGPTGIFDIYLSYTDAKNQTNRLMDAQGYCSDYGCDEEKIYEEIKEKVKTVNFYYKMIDGRYVFDYYEIV